MLKGLVNKNIVLLRNRIGWFRCSPLALFSGLFISFMMRLWGLGRRRRETVQFHLVWTLSLFSPRNCVSLFLLMSACRYLCCNVGSLVLLKAFSFIPRIGVVGGWIVFLPLRTSVCSGGKLGDRLTGHEDLQRTSRDNAFIFMCHITTTWKWFQRKAGGDY